MQATIEKRKYRRGVDGPVRVDIYDEDGEAVVLASATVSLIRQGVLLIDGAVADVTGGSYLTYTIEAEHLDQYEEDMTFFVIYVIGTTSRRVNFLISCLRTPLINNVVTADLLPEYPKLTDDLWTGEDNFQTQINRAFKQVEVDIEAKMPEGKADWLVGTGQIRELIINKAYEIIFRSFTKNQPDLFVYLTEQHAKRYDSLLTNTRFKEDRDDDAGVDVEVSNTTVDMER